MQRRTSANAAARVKTDHHWLTYQLCNWLNFITRDWPGLYVYKILEKRPKTKNRNIKKFHSRVFLCAFERYGEIRISATKIAILAKRDGRLAGGSQFWKIKLQ